MKSPGISYLVGYTLNLPWAWFLIIIMLTNEICKYLTPAHNVIRRFHEANSIYKTRVICPQGSSTARDIVIITVINHANERHQLYCIFLGEV